MTAPSRPRPVRPLLQTHRLGTLEIAPRVVAAMVAHIASECQGIAGMAGRGLRDGLAERLNRENVERGIELRTVDGALVLELYVVVEHGARISEVAHGLIGAVTDALERRLGVPVREVNVNVQGIHHPVGAGNG